MTTETTTLTCAFAIRQPQPAYSGDRATLCAASATRISRRDGLVQSLCPEHAALIRALLAETD